MAWSVLQSVSGGSNASTFSVTLPSNVTSGTKLIMWVSYRGSQASAPTTIKDGSGNSFASLFSTFITGPSTGIDIWVLDTPAGGVSLTATVTFTANGGFSGYNVVLQEVSGLLAGNTTAIFDGSVASTTATIQGGNFSQPAYTSTASNEYLVAVLGDQGQSATMVVPAGYTADANSINTSATSDIIPAYKNSTGGAETGTWNNSNTPGSPDHYTLAVIAFKLAAAGGPAGTVQPRATVPVPRRRLARAVWARITGQAYVAVPAPVQQYRLAPRRVLARGQWRGIAGQSFVAVPAPVQQYRLAPRRIPARAYVRFTPVVTTNAAAQLGPAGTVPVLMTNQTRVVMRRDGRVVRQ